MDAAGPGGWSWPTLEFFIGGAGGSAIGFLAKVFLFGRREGEAAGAAAARQAVTDEEVKRLRADFDRLQAELRGAPNRGDLDRLRDDLNRLEGDLKTVATKADVARIEQMLAAFVSRFDDRIDNLMKARA